MSIVQHADTPDVGAKDIKELVLAAGFGEEVGDSRHDPHGRVDQLLARRSWTDEIAEID